MDPLDHARPAYDGTTCAVCDGPVPARSVRLLAWREDLAFVQVECEACQSTTLAFVLGGAVRAAPPAPPVTTDDVLDMHSLLSGWRGGIRELLGESGRPSAAS